MPAITGIAHVELSVRDLDTSEAWYVALLGARRVFADRDDERGLTSRALREPGSGTVLALMQHDANLGAGFDATRTGLDHLAFAVADRDALWAWEQHLADLGFDYSPIEEWSHGAAVTARDPDGIAIEFYVRGAAG